MSKKFRCKTCAYCAVAGASETGDHVFAREFFLPDQRADLPKVPACGRCNGAKADLEHYLTTLLPFAGNHPHSSHLLNERVPERLARNQRLHRALADGAGTMQVTERGQSRDAYALPFDAEKLTALFGLITRGLVAHHWGVFIPADHMVLASIVNPVYEPILESFFRGRGAAYARGDLGQGSFRYEGQQFLDQPTLTLWRFQIYGGLRLTGDDRVTGLVGSTLWASSTPPGISNLLLEPE